jgi:excisionase family DNA binding protein
VSTISLQEAADRLGVHYMTAYRYVRTGRLRAERHAGRWRVAPDDLDALRAELTPPAGSRHQARLLDRLLAGDEAGAWLVVEQALVSRTTPDRAHLDLLAPCMAEVGRRWSAGTLSVGGEHVASATAMRVAARLAPLCARRGPHRGTVVLGGPPGEHHALPLTLLTNVLRARGWRVVELGPHTPVRDFVAAARGTDRLRAVGVSCASAGTTASAARVLAGVRAALPGTPLLAGGPGIAGEAVAESLGADGWGIDADAVDAWLDAGA